MGNFVLRTTLMVLCVAACVLSSPEAFAEPPDNELVRAEELHSQALAAWRANQHDAAVDLWEDALRLHPNWKYAYNQGLALEFLRRWSRAYSAIMRARWLGLPAKYAKNAARLVALANHALNKSHALVRLHVEPEGARVWVNGVQWHPPYVGWLYGDNSTVVVKRPGFISAKKLISHKAGKRSKHQIRLKPGISTDEPVPTTQPEKPSEPETPTPVTPAPVTPAPVTPEPAEADEPSQPETPSEPSSPTPQPPEQMTLPVVAAPSSAQFTWSKWTTLGLSVASLAGAGISWWIMESIVAGAESLNKTPAADYRKKREELVDRYDSAQISTWSFVGIGAAAAVTSVVLFFIDRDSSSESSRVGVVPDLIRGGAMVGIQF